MRFLELMCGNGLSGLWRKRIGDGGFCGVVGSGLGFAGDVFLQKAGGFIRGKGCSGEGCFLVL